MIDPGTVASILWMAGATVAYVAAGLGTVAVLLRVRSRLSPSVPVGDRGRDGVAVAPETDRED